MGCDIHGIFQRRAGDEWEDISSRYDQQRHYQLFAVLAGVRNGYGFAGVPTGEPVTPISTPRGLPADFTMDGESHPVRDLACLPEWRREYAESNPGEAREIWMGDHSHSWLSADEILTWTPPEVRHCGVLSRAQYEAWDKRTPPSDYCGGITGDRVRLVDASELDRVPGWTHVQCAWTAPLSSELAYFFDEVRRLKALHGDVRFVFGFDS